MKRSRHDDLRDRIAKAIWKKFQDVEASDEEWELWWGYPCAEKDYFYGYADAVIDVLKIRIEENGRLGVCAPWRVIGDWHEA